jgi:putative acetyltransferase
VTQPNLVIRDETPADAAAITEITIAAFASLEVSDQTEQFVVEALRAAGALTLSLVAELDDRVAGHIAFSPITISDGTTGWFGLGPVSVLPEYQQRGIGKALVWEGLSRLQALGGKGCCLVGHPEYYPKFGFTNPSGLAMEGVPPEVFFALSFDGRYPQGTVAFHEAFMATRSPAQAEESTAAQL